MEWDEVFFDGREGFGFLLFKKSTLIISNSDICKIVFNHKKRPWNKRKNINELKNSGGSTSWF
jgi:hypothetical protein